MDAVLADAGEIGPFVLVPESFRGAIAHSRFERSPDKVAGMVLVDASYPPEWFCLYPGVVARAELQNLLYQVGRPLGILRALLPLACSRCSRWCRSRSPPHPPLPSRAQIEPRAAT